MSPSADQPLKENEAPDRRATFRRRVYRIPLLGVLAYLVWPPRNERRTPVRRVASGVAAVVAVLGLGMVAYPVAYRFYPAFFRVPVEHLIAWSNVLSDLEANRTQDRLKDEFAGLTDVEAAAVADPVTRLRIPKIGVDTIVVEGTSPSALKAGAGHYPQTPLPGKVGNVGIAGHRTTYGRPFNQVHRLGTGDKIVLDTPVGTFTYRVSRAPWVTTPYDWSVVNPTEQPSVTLTTCEPIGSARQRLIVRATLIKSEPVGSAKASA